MKAFKGIPRDAHKFKKYCTHYDIKHTKEYCQEALTLLILKGNKKLIENKFGADSFGCFSQNDIKKFLKE